MDIYFCGSIRGGHDDRALYADLIEHLGEHGTVLTEHVGTEAVATDPESAERSDREIHDQDVAWLRAADVVVAEVTTPSLGVGYEIGRAVEWDTPVCCLYRPGGEHELSAMVRGNDDLRVVEYERPAEVYDTLAGFVDRHRDGATAPRGEDTPRSGS